MENNYLESKIKLKTGFFKKESYSLILNDQEIILKQNENKKLEEIKISAASVESISVSSEKPEEIEIITEKESFIGNFIDEKDISEIILFLKMIFGKKFNYF